MIELEIGTRLADVLTWFVAAYFAGHVIGFWRS